MQPMAYHSSTAVIRWPSVTGSDAGPARKVAARRVPTPGCQMRSVKKRRVSRMLPGGRRNSWPPKWCSSYPASCSAPVGGDHSRVAAGVGAGVVLEAVKFHDDASACGQQQEEVHPLPQQGGARAAGVGVVVQIHLWDQGRLIETVCPVPLAVLGQQELFGAIAVHRGTQPFVQV